MIVNVTTSNLPCFMDLTFQVLMQYFSLQHRTLLLQPVTSTTGWCFWFAPSLQFFWSYFSTDLQDLGAPTDLGSSSFSVLSFCVSYFHTFCVHGALKARVLKWFAISFSSGPCFVRTLHHELSFLAGPTWHGS